MEITLPMDTHYRFANSHSTQNDHTLLSLHGRHLDHCTNVNDTKVHHKRIQKADIYDTDPVLDKTKTKMEHHQLRYVGKRTRTRRRRVIRTNWKCVKWDC
eukprot:410716_1